MKKIAFTVPLVFALMLFLFIPVYAEDDLASEIGVDISALDENVPYDAENYIADKGISADNVDAVKEISPSDVIEFMAGQVKDKIKYPLRLLVMLFAVIIAGSIVENFGSCIDNKPVSSVYGTVCVLIAVGIISDPIVKCVKTASDTLYSGSDFVTSYIPVFSGIMASSGCITSASAYSAVMVIFSDFVTVAAANYLMPLVSICTALGIIQSINGAFDIASITDMISKAVKVILGLIMTVFIGLLSLQSIIGASADTIGVKAAKYLASNCIPVIGGAVADAYTTLKASLGILRGGVGFFGIAVIFVSVAPALVEVVLVKLSFCIAEIISGMFGIKGIKTLLHNSSSVLSMVISLLVCFGMMLIISTAVMMMTGLDVS
ncbi:MAG: hypothetical protein ACI4JK_08135 [Oscillospiraceae bacterium]